MNLFASWGYLLEINNDTCYIILHVDLPEIEATTLECSPLLCSWE